jgi:myo-inositol-1(or 4)-monophosphatase
LFTKLRPLIGVVRPGTAWTGKPAVEPPIIKPFHANDSTPAYRALMDAISDYFSVCEKAVRAAGATIQSWIGRTSVRHKGRADLVTEADVSAQEAIRKIVLGSFPEHALLGEEDPMDRVLSPPGAKRQTDNPSHEGGYRWIADPLDGTTNFVHGVPHYAVSLALEHRGRIVVGAIFDPNLDECFMAAAGRGATLNGRPIHTSGVTDLCEGLAATGFPATVWPESPDLLVFNQAIFQCQGVRRTGSAALNLAYLAAGRFDVLWAFSTKIWDVAAGILLAREAGGIITSPEGGEFILDSARYIAAATPALHGQLLQMAGHALVGVGREP